MCGISGYISKQNCKLNIINKTLNLMKRRGPDGQSFTKFNERNKEVGLLHSRLNIIDLNQRSNQPFKDNNFTITFNGEIYNYLEIKKELIKKNYKFKTTSDTEVLLKSYIEYGEKCVEKFIGMWAFAIWDNKKKILFLSRDIFGEKPLYYYLSEKGFFFGSEIKFIKSLSDNNFKINKEHVYSNLFNGYKSLFKTNRTFYKDIYILENATNISIDLNMHLKKNLYWKPKIKIDNKIDKIEAQHELRRLLTKSLMLRSRSDVPISYCLSGGVDSGILASIASKKLNQNISTFSIIDRDDRYNESENINTIIRDINCKNKKIIVKKDNNFLNKLNKLTAYHDGPVATISYYVHSLLTKEISNQKYKVSISGVGADELFTGYYDHYLLHLASIKNKKDFKNNLNYWNRYVNLNIRNPALKDPYKYIKNPNNRENVYESNFKLYSFAKQKNKSRFSENYFCNNLLKNRMLNELFNEIVPVILKHDDLNSMYNSIENRSPYLDKEIFNFAISLPNDFLINEGYQKKILRDSFKKTLHTKIRKYRVKKGFNSSISSHLNFKDKELIKKIFSNTNPISEFINLKKLKEEINFNDIPNHYSKFIFSLISTDFFLKSNY
tara:strand:+ start:275 stop:2104 length:1830 start_codon:yes stop_codon:yes gene_type:complete